VLKLMVPCPLSTSIFQVDQSQSKLPRVTQKFACLRRDMKRTKKGRLLTGIDRVENAMSRAYENESSSEKGDKHWKFARS